MSHPPSRLHRAGPRPILRDDGTRDGPLWLRASIAIAFGAGGVGLVWVLLASGDRPALLPDLIDQRLAESGVSHPVTSVLLNFRAFDTLLEVAVLVVAMIAVWSLDRGSRAFGRDPSEQRRKPVLEALTRVSVPLAWLTAVYLTWIGSRAPGGAFQAAALLAGAGVLLTTVGLIRPPSAASATVRGAAAAGLAGFTFVGVFSLSRTGAFLAYPEGWAYPMILGVEAVLTVSIAVVLVELFADVPAVPTPDPSLAQVDPTGDPLGRALRTLASGTGPAGDQPEDRAGGPVDRAGDQPPVGDDRPGEPESPGGASGRGRKADE